MKSLKKLLKSNPSYCKWGNTRLAEKLNISETEVADFKKTRKFRNLKLNYVANLA